jgi:hypothetical protein
MENCKEAARLTIKACGGINVLPRAQRDPEGRTLEHAVWMLLEIYWGKIESNSNKAHRWLGYAQALLVSHQWATLEQMKQANLEASSGEESGVPPTATDQEAPES